MRRANYQQLKIIQMEAKDYLKKIGITERVLNSEDLPEYWKSLSQLMEDYAALRQPLDSSSVCTCRNAETERDSLFPVFCTNCKAYVQTDR
jgi:hypothetical protein